MKKEDKKTKEKSTKKRKIKETKVKEKINEKDKLQTPKKEKVNKDNKVKAQDYYESFDKFKEELSKNPDAMQGLCFLINAKNRIKELEELHKNNIDACYELDFYKNILKRYEICAELLEDAQTIKLANQQLKSNTYLFSKKENK